MTHSPYPPVSFALVLKFDEDEGVWHVIIYNADPGEEIFIARYSEYEEAEHNSKILEVLTGIKLERE